MNRVTIGVLSTLALLLVFDAPLDAPRRESSSRPSVSAGGPPPLGAEDASFVVRRLNPELSAHEADRIGSAVVRYSDVYSLDPELVLAVILRESRARPWARSPKGALGLMQVMPYMASPLDMAGNHTTIESNIEAGCTLLANNIRRLGEEEGISAYFWGNEIRSVSYLDGVRAARAQVRALRRAR